MQRFRFLPAAWALYIAVQHRPTHFDRVMGASVGILLATTLGECARRWPSTRWLYAAVATSLALTTAELVSAWRHVLVVYEHLPGLALALVLTPVLHRYRAPGFAAGAAIASIATAHPAASMALYTFLFIRDVGMTPTTPARAHFTLTMMGILAVRVGLFVADDFRFAYMATDPSVLDHVTCDGPWTFVPRVLLEMSIVGAALAHIQGRTWSLVVLALAGPLLLCLVAITRMPVWCFYCGDFCVGHDLAGNSTPYAVLLALILAPWLPPLVRAWRTQGSSRR